MVSPDQVVQKKAMAKEVLSQLQQVVPCLPGSTVLDVGFGLGYNTAALKDLGATVFGVEPDTAAYEWATQQGNIDKSKAFYGTLQNMPQSFAGQIDVATVLLWNISRSQYDEVLSALSRQIQPTGMVVLGIHDEVYISDPYGVAVKPHAMRYFTNVRQVAFPGMWNQHLLICMNPKQ